MPSMDTMLQVLEYALPACVTFGPLFMIMIARGDADRRSPLTRRINHVGLGMLVAALAWLNLDLVVQRGKVSVLEARVNALEKRIEERALPSPGMVP